MTQPDVAVTGSALAVECSVCTYLLVPAQGSAFLSIWFIIFFVSIALASALGGTVHGFYEDPASSGQRILWPLTLLAIGLTALSGINIGALIHFEASVVRAISRIAAVVFFCFFALAFVLQPHFFCILVYFPPLRSLVSLCLLYTL